jgi:hypothetical protein
MLLAVYGDSLSLPRAVLGVGLPDTYAERVAARLSAITGPTRLYNRSLPGLPVKAIREHLERDLWYFGTQSPSCCVIQVGIVDCAPRSVPARLKQRIDRLPGPVRTIVVRVMRRLKPHLLRREIFTRETEPDAFRQHLSAMVTAALGSFDSVCVLNICPNHPAIAERSPGLPESIGLYNGLIASVVASARSDQVHLVDVHAAILEGDLDLLVNRDDGHHITAQGHAIYADALDRALLAEQGHVS